MVTITCSVAKEILGVSNWIWQASDVLGAVVAIAIVTFRGNEVVQVRRVGIHVHLGVIHVILQHSEEA